MPKKSLLPLLILLLAPMAPRPPLHAQDSPAPSGHLIHPAPWHNWTIRLVSNNLLYPTYLADPLGIRPEITRQWTLRGGTDLQDRINQGEGYLGKLTIKPAIRFSLLRLNPRSHPDLGVELDFGVALPFTMRLKNHDFFAIDGWYHMAVAVKPAQWLSLRVAKHHVCSHRGEEFWAGYVSSPIDFDPVMFSIYVRDDVVVSVAAKPLWFLRNPGIDLLQVHADLTFYVPGSGITGVRQNKPNTGAGFICQGGAEMEYYFKKVFLGGIFAAYNIRAWQENGFTPDHSLAIGYILPRLPNRRKARITFQYYSGRCLNSEFFFSRETFVALGLAGDF